MRKRKEIIRNYRMSDADMLDEVKLKLGFFTQDQTFFEAFDAGFGGNFSANWQADINAAETTLPDAVIIDQQAQLTEQVEELIEECKTKFQQLKYFIEKAFPDNPKIWDEFGYNDLRKNKRSQSNMILFMETLRQVMVKYRTELNAADYTDAMINDLDTLYQQLKGANTQQNLFIGNRPVVTRNRIVVLNTCWERAKQVCRAGKLIFATDLVKYEQYVLNESYTNPAIKEFAIKFRTKPEISLTLKLQGQAGKEVALNWGDNNETVVLLDSTLQLNTHSYDQVFPCTLVIAGHLEALTHFYLDNARLEEVNIPSNASNILHFSFQNNLLTEKAVDDMLVAINKFNTSNGILHVQGGLNAFPSVKGMAALKELKDRGWEVITN